MIFPAMFVLLLVFVDSSDPQFTFLLQEQHTLPIYARLTNIKPWALEGNLLLTTWSQDNEVMYQLEQVEARIDISKGAVQFDYGYSPAAVEFPGAAKFALAWHNHESIHYTILDEYGNVGERFILASGNVRRPTGCGLPDGKAVLLWEQNGLDGDSWGVYGQVVDSNGAQLSSKFLVNSYFQGAQKNPWCAAADSGFVVTWESLGHENGIFAQSLDEHGAKLAPEMRITYNENTITSQPRVTRGHSLHISYRAFNRLTHRHNIWVQQITHNGAPEGEAFQGDWCDMATALYDYDASFAMDFADQSVVTVLNQEQFTGTRNIQGYKLGIPGGCKMTELLPHGDRNIGDRRNAQMFYVGITEFAIAFEDRGTQSLHFQKYGVPQSSICHFGSIGNIEWPAWSPPEKSGDSESTSTEVKAVFAVLGVLVILVIFALIYLGIRLIFMQKRKIILKDKSFQQAPYTDEKRFEEKKVHFEEVFTPDYTNPEFIYPYAQEEKAKRMTTRDG